MEPSTDRLLEEIKEKLEILEKRSGSFCEDQTKVLNSFQQRLQNLVQPHILCLGEADFSFATALKICNPSGKMIATCSNSLEQEKLTSKQKCYDNVEYLETEGVEIREKIDATNLPTDLGKFNEIYFNFPYHPGGLPALKQENKTAKDYTFDLIYKSLIKARGFVTPGGRVCIGCFDSNEDFCPGDHFLWTRSRLPWDPDKKQANNGYVHCSSIKNSTDYAGKPASLFRYEFNSAAVKLELSQLDDMDKTTEFGKMLSRWNTKVSQKSIDLLEMGEKFEIGLSCARLSESYDEAGVVWKFLQTLPQELEKRKRDILKIWRDNDQFRLTSKPDQINFALKFPGEQDIPFNLINNLTDFSQDNLKLYLTEWNGCQDFASSLDHILEFVSLNDQYHMWIFTVGKVCLEALSDVELSDIVTAIWTGTIDGNDWFIDLERREKMKLFPEFLEHIEKQEKEDKEIWRAESVCDIFKQEPKSDNNDCGQLAKYIQSISKQIPENGDNGSELFAKYVLEFCQVKESSHKKPEEIDFGELSKNVAILLAELAHFMWLKVVAN